MKVKLVFSGVDDPAMQKRLYEIHTRLFEKCFELHASKVYHVKLSSSMRTSGGRAWYQKGLIEINYRLFLENPDQLEKTYAHELAHLLSYYEYGAKGCGHGRYWKSVMRRLEQKPERCHRMKVKRARWARHPAYCNCDKPHQLTSVRIKKIKEGKLYRCKACHSLLSAEKKQEEIDTLKAA